MSSHYHTLIYKQKTMDNLSKQPELYEQAMFQAANPTLSINEIKKYCKQLNSSLIEVIDRLDDILLYESFNENDRKYIQKRDIMFKEFILSNEEKLKHGDIIISNILEISLFEAIEKAINFFDASNKDEWYSKLTKCKTYFIRIDQDTDWILDTLNTLYQTFEDIFSGLGKSKLSEIVKKHNYINYDDIDVINYNFNFLSLEVSNEPDIIKKKNLLLEAITKGYMLCLQSNKDPDNYLPNVNLKTKCLKAIEILDFQIQNTTHQTITTIINPDNSETKVDNSELEPENQTKNKEFTTKRQVLAIYYMLNELDKNINSIDRTVKTRFIHFLTGKNESNIYKTLAEPHKGLENDKNNKSAIKDLEFIKQYFESIGLKSIVQKISNDMQEA